MIIDAIVPAYNEQSTVAGVLYPLVKSGLFRRVLVVNDGSSDNTTAVASQNGAWVLTLPTNAGKGAAMLAGFRTTDADAVAFFDADLIGLTEDHLKLMVDPILDGSAEMSCGLQDHGIYNNTQQVLPIISGQRVVARRILEAMPLDFWSGWRFEVGLNEIAKRLGAKVKLQILYGMYARSKWEKTGMKKGILDGTRMLVDVLAAIRDAQAMR